MEKIFKKCQNLQKKIQDVEWVCKIIILKKDKILCKYWMVIKFY